MHVLTRLKAVGSLLNRHRLCNLIMTSWVIKFKKTHNSVLGSVINYIIMFIIKVVEKWKILFKISQI